VPGSTPNCSAIFLTPGRPGLSRAARRYVTQRPEGRPKYQSKKDPKLKWSGRGATPVWMRNEMKGTKLKKENFLIK
jgi:DNA-binding protein H-NS